MTVFGTIAIFVKNIPLSTGEISLFRAVIGLMVIYIYKLFSGNRLDFKELKKDLLLLLLSGMPWAFNGYSYLKPISILLYP